MTGGRQPDAATLARARDLDWLAQRAMRGDPFGRHPGRDVGPGIEFSQYRPYEPGDDARWLDWLRLARGQDALVRLAPREARVTVSVVLDASASMDQPDSTATADAATWTRMHSARAIATLAMAVARRQGDAFHWLALQPCKDASSATHHATPGHSDAHLAHCVTALDALAPGGLWPAADEVRDTVRRLPREGLVIVISDFIESQHAIEILAALLSAGRRDVIALQLLTRDEVAFDMSGNVELVDRETGVVRRAHADNARAAYLSSLSAAQRTLRRTFRRRGAVFASALTDVSPDRALRPVLAAYQRARLARRPG